MATLSVRHTMSTSTPGSGSPVSQSTLKLQDSQLAAAAPPAPAFHLPPIDSNPKPTHQPSSQFFRKSSLVQLNPLMEPSNQAEFLGGAPTLANPIAPAGHAMLQPPPYAASPPAYIAWSQSLSPHKLTSHPPGELAPKALASFTGGVPLPHIPNGPKHKKKAASHGVLHQPKRLTKDGAQLGGAHEASSLGAEGGLPDWSVGARIEQERAEMEALQVEMELGRRHKQDADHVLLESWLNDVLVQRAPSEDSGADVLKVAPASLTGLSKFGLARGQLAGAGLSASTVERLYRSLYVYTVGFHDTLKELLTHSSERASLIAGVWRSFMTIAEKSLKLNWRSEFLQILEETGANEVEMNNMSKWVHFLGEANTTLESKLQEAVDQLQARAAATDKLALENKQLKARLDAEQQSHVHAVTNFVNESELRTGAQEDLIHARQQVMQVTEQVHETKQTLEEHGLLNQKLLDDKLELLKKVAGLEKQVGVERDACARIKHDNARLKEEHAAMEAQHSKLMKQSKEEIRTKIFLQGDLQKKKDKIVELSTDREAVQKQLSHQGKRLDSILDQHRQLKKQSAELKILYDATQSQAEALEVDLNKTRERLSTVTEKNNALKDEKKKNLAELASLRQAFESTKAENETLSAGLNRLLARYNGPSLVLYESALDQRNELGVGMATMTETLWRIQDQYRKVLLENQVLSTSKSQREEDLLVEVDEWKGKYTELSSTLEATMNNLEQQIKTLSEKERRLSQTIERLDLVETELEGTKVQLVDKKLEVVSLESIQHDLSTRMEVVIKKVTDLDETLRATQELLKAETNLRQGLEQEGVDLQQELENTKESLELQVKLYQEEAAAHQQTREALGLQRSAVSETQDKLDSSQACLDKKRTKKREYKAKYQATLDALEACEARLSSTSSRLEQAETRLSETDALLSASNEAIEKFKGQTEDDAGKMSQLNSQISSMEMDHVANMKKIKDLTKEIGNMEADNQQLLFKMQELEDAHAVEKEGTDSAIKEREQQISDLRDELAALNSAKEEAQRNAESAREQLEEAISNVEAEKGALVSALDTMKKARQEDEDRHAAKYMELEISKSEEIQSLQQQLDDKLAELESRNALLEGQRQEIEQAKAEREAELIARDSRIQELEAKIQEDETLHMEKCKEWEESTAEKEEEVLQMQTQIKELSEVALHHEAMMDNAKGILQSKLDLSESERMNAEKALVSIKAKSSEHIAQLQSEVADLRSELSTMQTLNKSLDTQLKARVFELEVETEAHASMKKLMGDEIDTLTNSLFTVREEKTITESRLKEELDSVIKTSGAEAKEIARQRKEIELAKLDMQETLRRSAERAASANAEVDSLRSEMAKSLEQATNDRVAACDEIRARLGGEVNRLQKDMVQTKQAHFQKQTALEAEIREHALRIQELEEENRNLKDKLDSVTGLLLIEKEETARLNKAVAEQAVEMTEMNEAHAQMLEKASNDLKSTVEVRRWLKNLPPRKQRTVVYEHSEKKFEPAMDDSMMSLDDNFSLGVLRPVIMQLFQEKIGADVVDDSQSAGRQSLETFVYDWFLQRFGLRVYAEGHLRALVETVFNNQKDPRVRMFGRLLGVLQPGFSGDALQEALNFYLNSLAYIHKFTNGPLATEKTIGHSRIPLSAVHLAIDEKFKESSADTVTAIKEKCERLSQESPDGALDLDDAMQIIMTTWEGENRALEAEISQRFQNLKSSESSRQVHEYDVAQFTEVVNSMVPGLPRKDIRAMFRTALQFSDSADKINLEGFMKVMRQSGHLSNSKGILAHPQLSMDPALFDEFLLIEESWNLMVDKINVVLEELGTLTSPRSGGPASNELSRQVDTFGDILRMPQRNGESAWVQYRKIIVTFSSCLNRLQNRRLEAKKVFADTLKMTRAAAAFIQSGNLGSSTNEGGVADPTENIYVQAMLAKASFLNKDKRENRAVLPRAIKTHSPTSSGTTSPTKRASQGESPLSPYSPGVSFNESPTENRRRSQAPPRSSLSPKRGRNNETGGLTVILDDEDANR